MKKTLSILVILFLIFAGTSCVNRKEEPPYGVWESQDPHILICFDPEYSNRTGYGYYYLDGETIELNVAQDYDGSFTLYNKKNDLDFAYGYFFGFMKVKNDGKLYYTMSGTFPETTGYDVIVFERIEEDI